jgi:uncharacterized membrane protein
MKSTPDKLVDDYLERLDRALAGIPRVRRTEVCEEIAAHIAEARSTLDAEDEAAVRTLLDRLGDPADIAAEAAERPAPAAAPARPRGSGWDVVALILLLIGGVIFPVVGWLVGVVILWASATWTTREKLVGTLIVPFGLALPTFLLTLGAGTSGGACFGGPGRETTCTDSGLQLGDVLGAILSVGLILASIGSVVFLARRRSRASALA